MSTVDLDASIKEALKRRIGEPVSTIDLDALIKEAKEMKQQKKQKTIPKTTSKFHTRKAAPGTTLKKIRRHRPGVQAEREIRRLQKQRDKPLFRCRPFQQLVRQIVTEIDPGSKIRFQTKTLIDLKNNAEVFMNELLGAANLVNRAEGRETLDERSIHLLQNIRSRFPRCMSMLPALPQNFQDLQFLIRKVCTLAGQRKEHQYRQLMQQINEMDDAQSVAFMRDHLTKIYTERLSRANVQLPEFDTDKFDLLAVMDHFYSKNYNRRGKLRHKKTD